ncbi:RdgB/HAM1 family non-canonical purine NTP pyrophosphatase [Candidatus Kaiserbacteria bacterium]|nr:RdgB/HAM1 family non-canonical purine NTP pyrophosphatase [Candidatus Kaiserbacteria bacterium]
MRELLIATSNKGKLSEMLAILTVVPFTILTLADVDAGGDVEETGTTLEENAILKAKTYGARTGKLTIAEDTGLEVDFLNGGPGVRTARYTEGSDDDRNQKLLRELQDVPEEGRGAQFRTVAAMYDPVTDKVRTSEGICHGRIAREGKGKNGFGYSPVFFVDELGKTMAELDIETRNSISHRGKALAKARDILIAEFS